MLDNKNYSPDCVYTNLFLEQGWEDLQKSLSKQQERFSLFYSNDS